MIYKRRIGYKFESPYRKNTKTYCLKFKEDLDFTTSSLLKLEEMYLGKNIIKADNKIFLEQGSHDKPLWEKCLEKMQSPIPQKWCSKHKRNTYS